MTQESWDIMSGTAVEKENKQIVTITGKGMTKAEFDRIVLAIAPELSLKGWLGEFKGWDCGSFKAIFTKRT